MRPDPGRRLLEERLLLLSPQERRRIALGLRRRAFARVWAAAERAGPLSELERARFILRRLYPELEGPRLEAVIADLAARERAGRWHGFSRQPPRFEEAEETR